MLLGAGDCGDNDLWELSCLIFSSFSFDDLDRAFQSGGYFPVSMDGFRIERASLCGIFLRMEFGVLLSTHFFFFF